MLVPFSIATLSAADLRGNIRGFSKSPKVHPIFFGLRGTKYRWPKSCNNLLLAVECCTENNRAGDFLNWRHRRAAV